MKARYFYTAVLVVSLLLVWMQPVFALDDPVLDDPNVPVVGEPNVPEELRMPGMVEGTGTYFEINDSNYLNITFASTEPVSLFLESAGVMIVMDVNAAEGATSAQITLSGFEPSTTYYKYEDDYHNGVDFTTDEYGGYAYTQDLTDRHLIFIQTSPSTIFLSDSGWSNPAVGSWDPVTKTGVLTTDVYETIQIDSPGITLDGNGRTITGTGNGVYVSYGKHNVTIRNLTIRSLTYGIYSYGVDNCTITGNTIGANNTYGICLNWSDDCTITENNISNNQMGIYCVYDVNSTISNNVLTGNSSYGLRLYWSNGSGAGSDDMLTISDNAIDSSSYGMQAQYCDRIAFQRNTVSNTFDAIYTISSNYGDGIFDFSYNNIENYSRYALRQSNSGRVDMFAAYNWWGSAHQADIEAAIYDEADDDVKGRVFYCPWLLEPYPTALTALLIDGDGDGYNVCEDCNDANPSVNPGVDNDGDGYDMCTDCNDNDPHLNYDDIDGDTVSTCDGDCDDFDSSKFPPYDGLHITSDFTFQCTGAVEIHDKDNDGIIFIDASGITVDGNGVTIKNPSPNYSGTAIQVGYNSSDVAIRGFNIEGCMYGVRADGYNSDRATITDNNFVSCLYGLYMRNSSEITDNSFYGNSHSIRLYRGMDVSVTNNYFEGGGSGIYFDYATTNSVASDNVMTNLGQAIRVHSVTNGNNTIERNTVTECSYGIYSYSSNGNVFRCNNLSNNNTGIYNYRDRSGSGNTYINNTITGSRQGLYSYVSCGSTFIGNTIQDSTYYGLYLYNNSNFNTFYNNSFVNNATQTYIRYSTGNIFNVALPEGGNHWSDWTGPDSDGDGLVDAPYLIYDYIGKLVGQDKYPYVDPFAVGADETPPETTAAVSGVFGDNGWYVSDVTVTLTATDEGGAGPCGGSTGGEVDYTEYSLDEANWTVYTEPVVVSEGCAVKFYYHSVDTAGNVENTKTVGFKVDKTPPEITCPADVTLECPANTEPEATGTATATDNCDSKPSVTYHDAVSGSCQRVIERRWTAVDMAGNSVSSIQTITVVDTTPPTIKCPADVTLECPADTSVAANGTAAATDTCSDVTITSSDVWTPGCGNTGTLARTWTATDACGNSSSCAQIITVVDTTPPVFTALPADMTVQRDGNGNISELEAWLNSVVQAADSCSQVTISNDYASFPYECGKTGSHTVTWTATDECGNKSTASASFTIEDPTAGVTYDGDSLLSTAGAPTVNINLAATLRDADGQLLDIDKEDVIFSLVADGLPTVVVSGSTVDGVATVVQALEPAIYEVTVSLGCLDFTSKAIIVVYNPEDGFATGGGWIVPAADGLNTHTNVRANFGFNAKYQRGSSTGHLEFRYSDGYIDLKSTSIELLVITGGKIAQFKGWAKVNGQDGNWFFVKAIDNGEPGTNDTFEIKIWAPGVDPEGDPTERAGDQLQGGNIVVHTKDK